MMNLFFVVFSVCQS